MPQELEGLFWVCLGLFSIWFSSCLYYGIIKFTFLPLNVENRMLRFGLGFHDDLFFIRIDLWFFGIRVAET